MLHGAQRAVALPQPSTFLPRYVPPPRLESTRETLARVRTSKTLMVSATATVAINYAWILYTVDFLPPSFQFYLALGAGYWACAGLIGFRLAQGWEQFLFLTVDDSDSERTGLSEKA